MGRLRAVRATNLGGPHDRGHCKYIEAALALERFHYLHAAVTGVYTRAQVLPDLSRGLILACADIDFAVYGDATLPPVLSVKLHP